MSDKMFELKFSLKFQAKQLNKAAAKAEKEHADYKKKVAARIAKGDLETAKIFAGPHSHSSLFAGRFHPF
jgi:hypothetical protein